MEYRSAPADIEKKISVGKPTQAMNISPGAKKIMSPQGTRWFVEIDPDYTSMAKPWDTTLQIGAASGKSILLQVDFKDHGNTFSAQWINEELLFVQVWWGRIASSDFILDVSTGKFIYDKLANYGELIEPCQEK